MWQGGREFRPFEPDPFKLVLGFSARAISDAMAALICHGVFRRHPGVRIAVIENGSNWVKALLQRFDHVYGQMPREFAEHPRETFRRHVFVSPFYEEPILELSELIGTSQILFGSDFPHPEGLAEPLDFVNELEGFDDDAHRAIMGGNLEGLLEGGATA
jgi:predicted TIM-barrel fold metal-dependent hydrolase